MALPSSLAQSLATSQPVSWEHLGRDGCVFAYDSVCMRPQERQQVFFLFGSYVAPEYASTGMLNERSDVYSFGILIMEIISGRNPVDYNRPPEEVCTI